MHKYLIQTMVQLQAHPAKTGFIFLTCGWPSVGGQDGGRSYPVGGQGCWHGGRGGRMSGCFRHGDIL